ncbi:MAG: AlwI family type II restriction endonuclease, partial [Patescibacteria group bacterium]
MAKTSRTKEIWHIPKRGNVHQTIYMVNLLTWDKFLQKSWSNQKQEMIASEMGKAGLTESGKAISHQSVRTLLANLPKYLGFVYIDESSTPSKVVVTDAGYELLRVHDIESIKKHKNLREYKDAGDLIDISPMFEKQMIKLIITNPTIKRDCENILVFPFRLTLKLLLELEYLDMEEIAYILFHSKNEDEQELLKQRILNFRNLSPDSRSKEIGAYRSTEEGNLTLVKAPSAGYYMYLCCSTGICSRDVVKVNKIGKNKLTAIKLIDKDKAQALLSNYSNISAYDFRDNMKLWMEYFANPNIIEPPFKLELCTNSDTDILVVVKKGEDIIGSDILGITNKSLNIEVFSEAKYTINVYELSTGKKISEDTFTASKDATVYAI